MTVFLCHPVLERLEILYKGNWTTGLFHISCRPVHCYMRFRFYSYLT